MSCLGDLTSISCPNERTILITKGTWGKYEFKCNNNTCCAPNPAFDCTADLESNAPDYFEYLKYECDEKTTCTIENNYAFSLDECEQDHFADYMQVFLRLLARIHFWPCRFHCPYGFRFESRILRPCKLFSAF